MAKRKKDREFNIEIHFSFFMKDRKVSDFINTLPPNPETSFEQGERYPKRNLPRTGLVVYLSRAANWDASFEEHWRYLQEQFWPYSSALEEFSNACDEVRCTIVVDYVGRFPLLYFPREFVSLLSNLNAILEVDVLDGL